MSSPSSPTHDPYAAWRNAAYRLMTVGWFISLIGYQMQSATLRWEVYQTTGSAMALGWLGLIQAVPVLLLALHAGHVADRFNRLTVVIAGTVIAALCSVGLAVVSSYSATGHGSVYLFYVPLLLNGAALTFVRPARSALLPQIVGAATFNNAVTWSSTVFEISSVLGPALGGLIIVQSLRWTGSLAAAYGLAAICSLVYVAALILVRRRCPPQRPAPHRVAPRLTEGVRYVWHTPIVLGAMTLDLFAVILGGAVYVLPMFAKRLDVGAVGYGWLSAAPAFGGVAMAMTQAHMPPMRHAGRTLLWCVAGFGAATIVFGLSHTYWLSLLMLALTGVFDNVSVVVRQTLVQVLTPDAMRGRVSAVNQVFIGASNEIGGFESGVAAQLFGLTGSVVGGGIGTLLVVLTSALIFPALRRFGSLHDAVPVEPPGFDPILPASSE